MKTYEITDNNDWEGETFGFIVELTEEQYEKISKGFDVINEDEGDERVSIEECNYTADQVALINKKSRNSYMDRLGYYKLEEGFDLDNFEYSDFPYKGNGMERLEK